MADPPKGRKNSLKGMLFATSISISPARTRGMIHLLVQTRAVGDAPAGVVATGNADTTAPRIIRSVASGELVSTDPLTVVRIEGGRAVFGFRANHERKRPVFFFE
jgi:hypothetical protein